MKYTSEIEINSPIDSVIELFDNPDNMEKWMKGLQTFEPIS
jgi:carbon monoxide dehydrogenase subunit G